MTTSREFADMFRSEAVNGMQRSNQEMYVHQQSVHIAAAQVFAILYLAEVLRGDDD